MATRRQDAARKPGRPSKYKEAFDDQARTLCIAGWTDKQMAEFFKVSESTFNLWKIEHPSFSESLKAKGIADADVVASLYQRAVGYSHPDVHISNFQGAVTITPIVKHYPPDPTSMIFWLKNRQSDQWRDKVDGDLPTDLAKTLAEVIDRLPG